jgi:hypothetical protein
MGMGILSRREKGKRHTLQFGIDGGKMLLDKKDAQHF